MKKTWKSTPTIINSIPEDDKTMILFVDESGEGNKKMLLKAFELKEKKGTYNQRNDLYILNGVILSGKNHKILQKRFLEIKKMITPNGLFEYKNKGIRPIVIRNHNIVDKNPPFNNIPLQFYERLNKIINFTDFKQIAAGLNYYTFTQCNHLDNKSSPLLMALGSMIINYAEYLNSINKKGIIIFEEETAKHDQLKLNYIKKVLFHGNKTNTADYFKNIKAVYFRKKWTEEEANKYVTTAGLELADLTLSPLRRIFHPEFQLIERKLYNYPNYPNKGIISIK